MIESDYTQAHKHAIRHRVEVLRSTTCGCYHCLAIFETAAIRAWIDTGLTALCPECGMDAVVGDESGYPITEGFLSEMNHRWFKQKKLA